MKIDIENLGSIDKGSIELNDFTIFCGKNNSGKTYAMYSIYALLGSYKDYGSSNILDQIRFDCVESIINNLKPEEPYSSSIDKFLNDYLQEILDTVSERFKNYLPTLFGISPDKICNSNIRLNLSNEEIKKYIKNTNIGIGFDNFLFEILNGVISCSLKKNEQEPYNEIISYQIIKSFFSHWFSCDIILLPAERAGINLFYKELFSVRNLLLQKAQNDNVDPMFFLKDIVKARYAQPIKDYLQYLSVIGSTRKETSNYQEYAQKIEKDVLGGKYQVDEFGDVYFKPSQSENPLPLHFSSSTVKTLFGLVFYLEHLAKEGDYLMIDEPELNLHPDNQRQVARVLVQLVNAGLKVIVSTHSNYFMREINNMIMLDNDFKGVEKLRKKYKYQPHELLNNKRISAYLFDKNEITSMQIDEEGVIADTFDTVTDSLNQSSNDIYYTMQDAKEIDD